MKQLILGGARSGKSRYAEQQATSSNKQVYYIATATADDGEMQQRIALHQQQRPAHWQLIEEPMNLSATLKAYNSTEYCLLVDCLTLWLSNCLAYDSVEYLQNQQNDLLETLKQIKSDVIFVSNEVGQGIVPMGELTRTFVDEAGQMHQQLAQVCDQVTFIVAGLPQILKAP